jgi:hypothetical protein
MDKIVPGPEMTSPARLLHCGHLIIPLEIMCIHLIALQLPINQSIYHGGLENGNDNTTNQKSSINEANEIIVQPR